ncbi:MAG: hypothetical protein AMS22_08000 [Thiotrichales bacterium SG8_50]|nr:MAG: hypothetical protein AMS22_08000 [Thiotrichales bacterium SG8_50]
MVRKRIRRILSGSAVVVIVLFCTLDVNGQFGGEAITYTISGSTGVAGVTMVGLPGEGSQTVVTDQNGYYNATVVYGWAGTVKPVKEGYTFEPASKSYQRVTADMAAEDYIPTPITYTISGRVTGAEGVELVGLPGNPITGSDGSYSVTVPYGWGEMVTPTKEGFTFTPFNKVYPPTKADKTNENYTAELVKLLITGSVQEAGVTMKGLPDNPVTGSNGAFSVKVDYGWTGTITPEKEGYEFQPASLPYTSITTDQTNQNFIATALTYVVSGTAGMAGVEMRGLPGTYTDGNGYFAANVKHGFTGTVTPFKEGWKFDPASWMLAKVNSDRTQSFSAETIKLTISGTTRLPGVEMNGLPGNPVTGPDGSYRVTVEYGFTGTVTPIKEGYKFTPESKTYPAITANTVDQPFSGERMTFIISGTAQIPGVSIRVMPGGRPVVADATGAYTATVDYGWTGTITPSKDGYEFMPPSIQFDNVMASQSGQDFMPTLLQRKISGTVRDATGRPVADVAVVADNNGGQTTTGAAGEFELSVGHGWSGTLTPLKEGYTFRPTNKLYSRVSGDQLNQAFTATIKMFDVSGEVKLGGVPIDGVLITASDGSGSPITATTDLKGKYSLKLPYGWTGEIAPTKEGIRFSPPSQSLINVTTNIVDGQPVVPAAPPEPVIRPTPEPSITPGPSTTEPVVEPTGPAPPPGIGPGAPGPTVEPTGPEPPAEVTPMTPEQKQMQDLLDKIKDLEDKMAGGRTVGAPTAAGPAPEPGSVLITNVWFESDLVLDVLPALAEQAGIPIIPDETVGGLVTLAPTNVPLDQVLDMVLASTPFVWKKTPYYYLIASAGIADPKFPTIAETRRVRLNYITAEAAVNLLSRAFRPYVQAEIPMAIPGEAEEVGGASIAGTRLSQTYTVLVTAPPVLMERILEDLKLVDKVPDQVLLKARIVSMNRTDLLNLGVEWSWPTMQLGFFSGDNYGQGDPLNDFAGETPWGIQMGYSPDVTFTNSLQLALNLLTVNGEATILSKPQVLAQDGKRAQMRVINEEYFFLTADQPQASQFFYQSSQLETIESGTTLTITPHIGENNDIMLQIAIEVSDSIPRGRETELPIVTRRTAENNVRVLDGGTVALAGLTQDKTITTDKRTPGLSNLPLIGGLFNNSDDLATSREVAVFVTAYILRHNAQRTADIPQALDPGYSPPASQSFSTPAELGFDRQSMNQGFGRTPADQGFGRTTVDQDFNQTPVDQGFNRTQVDRNFNLPPAGPAPTRPMQNDFQAELSRSLSRNRGR